MKGFGKILIALILISLFSLTCTNNKNSNSSDKKDEILQQKDNYQRDDISILTIDSITLSASFYYFDGKKDIKQPCIILIHQFKQDKGQWSKSFIDSLLDNNFKVLTFDIRGHGNSQKLDYPLNILLGDPVKAPNDITAVFKRLTEATGVDTNNIGVMGTSIGGNLGLYSMYFLHAKACISISNHIDGFTAFTGMDPRMMGKVFPKVKNVLLICGSKDDNNIVEQGQLTILDTFLEEPKEIKVFDSDKHGKYLIELFPEIYTISLNWFKKYL